MSRPFNLEELTPLTGPVKRRPFLVLDIESKDGDTQNAGFTRPFMVGVYGLTGSKNVPPVYHPFFDGTEGGDPMERYWQPGGCVDRAMRFVLQKRFRGHHIYAHNAGRFDFLFLLPWLMQIGVDLGFRFSIIPVASSIQVLDVWRGKEAADGTMKRHHVWRFLDSYRLIPTSLDKAAKSFGMKGKVSHDLHMVETDPSWVTYNGQDCSELYGVLEKFHNYIENVLLGEVGVTAPATAMKIFRRNYLKRPLPRSVGTHDFVRLGYFGGRTEPFDREGENLRYYDINSSYPAAMREVMPAGESTVWEGPPPERFKEQRLGFVEADVFVPDMHIPVLPVRAESGKLIFPTGNIRGVWEWDELQLAMEEGAQVVRWGKSAWFEPLPIFRDFVVDLYKYRDKSRPDYDPGLAEVVKVMLNASYGKFGMKTLRKKLYLFDDPNMPAHARPLTSTPDSLIYVAEEETDACYIMPQIAARVTALGRIRLYRYMKQACCKDCWPMRCSCGRNEIVCYTDTDSILTPTTMATGPALGDLKDELVEESGRLKGRFFGPKVYILSTKIPEFPWEGDFFMKTKAKGIERSTREKIETLTRGGTIYQKRLEKVGTLARAGFTRGPRMVDAPKRFLETDGKRMFNEDGTTSPHKVAMW
jgi:hypothetical protein